MHISNNNQPNLTRREFGLLALSLATTTFSGCATKSFTARVTSPLQGKESIEVIQQCEEKKVRGELQPITDVTLRFSFTESGRYALSVKEDKPGSFKCNTGELRRPEHTPSQPYGIVHVSENSLQHEWILHNFPHKSFFIDVQNLDNPSPQPRVYQFIRKGKECLMVMPDGQELDGEYTL